MDLGSFLLVGAGLILVAFVWLAVDVAGQTAAEEAKEAVFRRSGFRERRGRARGWLVSGYLSFLVSAAAGLFAGAALTSGDPADEGEGRLLAAVALALLVLAVVLLLTWWRRAGRPRHF